MPEMQDNPFSALLDLTRKDIEGRQVPPWIFGTLKSLSPLAVEIGGQIVNSGVFINPSLLPGSVSLSGISGSLQGSPQNMSVTGGSLAGTGAFSRGVSPGERVVLLQSPDGQEYVVLCGAVNA